ncbi:MAG: hypothetical protein IT200_07045 [Thermoleophilia bacterium]|nr:hypothetical protein [Thermoleophilia bacterium]
MSEVTVERLPTHPSISAAPLPTRRTLRRRRNPFIQLLRFALLNARMGYIALRGHR